jgi:hypothetical protein
MLVEPSVFNAAYAVSNLSERKESNVENRNNRDDFDIIARDALNLGGCGLGSRGLYTDNRGRGKWGSRPLERHQDITVGGSGSRLKGKLGPNVLDT